MADKDNPTFPALELTFYMFLCTTPFAIRAEHLREIRNRHVDDVKSAVSIHHLCFQSRHSALCPNEDSSLQDLFAALQVPPQVYNLVVVNHVGVYF